MALPNLRLGRVLRSCCRQTLAWGSAATGGFSKPRCLRSVPAVNLPSGQCSGCSYTRTTRTKSTSRCRGGKLRSSASMQSSLLLLAAPAPPPPPTHTQREDISELALLHRNDGYGVNATADYAVQPWSPTVETALHWTEPIHAAPTYHQLSWSPELVAFESGVGSCVLAACLCLCLCLCLCPWQPVLSRIHIPQYYHGLDVV